MKKLIVTLILLSFQLVLFSQNLDLIVTTKGDSIACKIDSIVDSQIYLQLKTQHSSKWVHTIYNVDNLNEYKYDCIEKEKYIYKKGTSIIVGIKYNITHKSYFIQNLEHSSHKELEAYMDKALKLKKTGKTVTIVGGTALGAGALLFNAAWNNEWGEGIAYTGLYMVLGGIGATIVGIPILITGSSRVKRINTIKNTAYDGIKIDLKPCAQYNLATQNYQPGVTLRIRF